MVSTASDEVRYLADTVQDAVKILVLGAFGAGKTTLISSVSEITPLCTEERLTQASVGVDDLTGRGGKDTTTVALDFGRLTLNPRLVLYLFGAPGQPRFWDTLPTLALGAAGALVLTDTRRLDDTFAVLDLLETQIRLPFVIAVNTWPDTPHHTPAHLRDVLDLTADTPVVTCSAPDRASSIDALITLVAHAIHTMEVPA